MPELYKRIFEASPVPLAIESSEQRLVEVNAAFCEALRASPEQLLSEDPNRLMPMPPVRAASGSAPGGEAGGPPPEGRIQTLRRLDGSAGRFLVSRAASQPEGADPLMLWALVELPESSAMRSPAGSVVTLNLEELLDSLSFPVMVLDADHRIVHLNHRTRMDLLLPAGRARPGASLSSLGDPGWERLAEELAKSMRHPGTVQLTVELPRADGSRRLTEIDATELSAEDGTIRRVLALRDSDRGQEVDRRQLDEHGQQARSDAYNRASNALVGLAALLQLNASRRRRSEQTMRNVASQVMAMSAIYAWQARNPDRLPLIPLVRSVVANQSRAQGLTIPFDKSNALGSRPATSQPYLSEKDAITLVLAMDEMIANAIAQRSPDSEPSTRLSIRADAALFEVRHACLLTPGELRDLMADETGGLGLLKTLLPAGARLTLAQEGGDVVTSLLLTTQLLQFE